MLSPISDGGADMDPTMSPVSGILHPSSNVPDQHSDNFITEACEYAERLPFSAIQAGYYPEH